MVSDSAKPVKELKIKITRKDTWTTDEKGYFVPPIGNNVSKVEPIAVKEYNAARDDYLERVEMYEQLSAEDKKIICFEECVILRGEVILEDEAVPPVFTLKMVNGQPKVMQN